MPFGTAKTDYTEQNMYLTEYTFRYSRSHDSSASVGSRKFVTRKENWVSIARNFCLPILVERVATAREITGTKFQKTLIFTLTSRVAHVDASNHTNIRILKLSQKTACPYMVIYRTQSDILGSHGYS